MRKIFLIIALIICPLFLTTAHAQNWLWVKSGVNDSNYSSAGDPLGIAADSSGNVFETGVFLGRVDFGSNSINTPSSIYDAYIVKYDNTGNAQWASAPVISSYAQSVAWSVATDVSGNSYITGYYTDTITFGSYTLTGNTYPQGYFEGEAYLTKYNSSGNVVWAITATQPSSASFSNAETLTVDNAGNVYVAGYFTDTITFGAYTLITGNPNNTGIFVVKFSSSGSVIWAEKGEMTNNSFIIDSYDMQQMDICNAPGGNLYLAGCFANTFSFGSVTLNNGGLVGNFFLLKLNSSGTPLWGKSGTVSGSGGVLLSYFSKISCTVDLAGNIYVGGIFTDSLQIGTYMLSDATPGAGSIFLAKYNPSGSVLWAEESSEEYNYDYATYSLSADKWNNVYYTGNFQDTMAFGGTTWIDSSNVPSFLLKMDTSGHVLCGTSIDNYNDDNNAAVANPLGQNAYFTGDVFGDSCRFGSYLLTGTEEWAFMGKWSCAPCMVSASASGSASICEGSSAQLSASGGISYSWSPPQGLNSTAISNPLASPYVTTTYTVTVSNGSCSATDTVTVFVHPGPPVSVCCDSVIEQGQSVQLSASGGATYNWIPPVGLSCYNCPNPVASPNQSTTYSVTITTDSGCTITRVVTIDINCGNVFVPNAFSPNNDGQNDILYVRGPCIKTINFMVFDRWGNRVFESDDINNGWDGTYKGQQMNTGTYVWYLKATMLDGSTLIKKGSVALVR